MSEKILKVKLKIDRNWKENEHILEVTNLDEAIKDVKKMVSLSDFYIDNNWVWKKYWSHVLEELIKLKDN